MARNGVIGRGGALPWRLPSDLRRFRQITTGHHILMGRKTFESIGRPLPDRTTIVISRQPGYRANGVLVATSLEAALQLAENRGETEAFVVGGAEIYRPALPLAGRLYLTEVDAEIAGDTWFPQFDRQNWHELSTESLPPDEKNEFGCKFTVLARKQ